MGEVGLPYLLGRVGIVEQRIRTLVAHRRADDPSPDDPFRGLYLTDEAIDRVLAPQPPPAGDIAAPRERIEADADAAEAAGGRVRLRDLVRSFDLTDLDAEILLIAAVPDLDSRFEKLYGYLNDDVTRRRASIGLTLDLLRLASVDLAARSRLTAGSPLVDGGLVIVQDADRPFLTRALRVPDRVIGYLLGDDRPDPDLARVLPHRVAGPDTDRVLAETGPDTAEAAGETTVAGLARALGRGQQLTYLRETLHGNGIAFASAALRSVGRPMLRADLTRLAGEQHPGDLVRELGREALLRGAGVVAGPVEAVTSAGPDLVRQLAGLPGPVLLVGGGTWDPDWSARVPLPVTVPALPAAAREALWQQALATLTDNGAATRNAVADPAAETSHFQLSPEQVVRAVQSAAASALLGDGMVDAPALRRGARAQNAAGLERLARRIEPAVAWSDIVLPAATVRQLREVTSRARHRDQVLTGWRMRPGGGRGRGITALFAGDSGTGKTMSAEVIAADLGLDLYAVNLATVVDKYVGETEKNLERIFAEAGGVNAVLLFDEADAIFGKRSEVRDAHDRYANIESAYLLQRMETFDGLAILSTNLRANIDEAFTRRLDAIIDFPAPDETARLALWQRCLGAPLPVADDVDLDFCARSFTLSGGNIRSAAITAAYRAAEAGGEITMPDLVAAVAQEYRKLGRLVLEREFGPYLVRN